MDVSTIQFVVNIKAQIINPLIGFMIGVAFIIFLYGVVEMLRDPNNSKSAESGKKHMIWGVIGLFIMVSVMGIASLVMSTINVIAK